MIKPVEFATAKLLKEKGFGEPCKEGYYLPHPEIAVKESVIPNIWQLIPVHPLLNQIPAPTIAQVIMWLYEKHGIWIQGAFPYNSKWEWVIFLLKELLEGTDGYKNVMSLHHEPYTFNSPTEAYEAAIEYALTNLI